jgi:hypothetical protein
MLQLTNVLYYIYIYMYIICICTTIYTVARRVGTAGDYIIIVITEIRWVIHYSECTYNTRVPLRRQQYS